MTRALKVPIHVDTLVMPKGRPSRGVSWSGSTTTPVFEDAEPLPPGVHLQWALPDALARGDISEDGDVRFPTVPDRWLVVRWSRTRSRSDRAYAAWMVDAQRGGAPVALESWFGGRPAVTTPRLTAAGLQNADGELLEIDGVKGPTVASYYRDCAGRFGFHDPLNTGAGGPLSAPVGSSPPSKGPLSYLVVGWYADPARDPFKRAGNWSARQEWLEEMGWALDSLRMWSPYGSVPGVKVDTAAAGAVGQPATGSMVGAAAAEFDARPHVGVGVETTIDGVGQPSFRTESVLDPALRGPITVVEMLENVDRYTLDTAVPPDRLYLHGQVVDVAWGGEGGAHFDPNVALRPDDRDADPPRITIGSSLSEALAQSVGKDEVGVFVEAVQHGLTGQLASAEGLERLPHLLHERSFASQPSTPHTHYVVEMFDEDTPTRTDTGPRPEGDDGPSVKIPGALSDLSKVPRDVDTLVIRDHRSDRMRPAVGVGTRPTRAGMASNPMRATRPGAVPRTSAGMRIDRETRSLRGVGDRVFTGPVKPTGMRVESIGQLVQLADIGLADGVVVGRGVAAGLLGGTLGGNKAYLRAVKTPRPRWWKPNAPALLVHGPKRSYRHGFDGRFHEDGKLVTRAEGQGVDSLLPHDVPAAGRIRAGAVVTERSDLQRLPPAARELVREAVLLDPSNAERMAELAAGATQEGPAATGAYQRRFEVETTFWWGARSAVARTDLAEHSGYSGLLPSPIALRPWTPGWAPVLLEVEVEYLPTDGALGVDWPLGGVEHAPTAMPPSLGTNASRHSFRLLPTAGAVRSLADSLATLVAERERTGGLSQTKLSSLRLLVGQIERMDLLTCSLSGLDDQLRAAGLDLRAGALRVVRARLVDVFGQVVPITKAGAANAGEEVELPSGESAVLLSPRVPQWSRLMFRLMDAELDQEATPGGTSVCGWLLPDHVEHAVEVFDGGGRALGQLRHRSPDSLHVVWEPAPGAEPPVGLQAISTIADPRLAGVVQGILDANLRIPPVGAPFRPTESALSALVRVIDTVQGTVDRVGDTQEYLSTVLGRPVAVVRAHLRYEVKDPDSGHKPAPKGLEVRLGSLAQLDDGLLAYYVDGDYSRIHPPDPLVGRRARPSGPRKGLLSASGKVAATPIDNRFVSVDPTVDLQADVTRELTMLMDPRAGVHAAMGVLPRKRIALDRDQVDAALATLAPTFRAGPVLIDPAANALPVPSLQGFAWSWTRREGPPGDAAGWSDTPIKPSTGAATVPDRTVPAHEGWLRLSSD